MRALKKKTFVNHPPDEILLKVLSIRKSLKTELYDFKNQKESI